MAKVYGRLLREHAIEGEVTSSRSLRGPVRTTRFHDAVASAGPGLADILWRVVCAGEGMREAETALGWPARAGKLVLALALDRIADHYRVR